MRGTVIATAAFVAGLVLGYAVWNEGGAGGRAGRSVVEQRTPSSNAPLERNEESHPVASSGRITGSVRANDGSPTAGVAVVASPLPEAAPKRAGTASASAVEATSRDDGSYELPIARGVIYSVAAFAEGLAFRTVGSGRARAGGVVDFVGTAVGRIPVTVEIEGESPPERARVLFLRPPRGASGETAQSWSSADPWIVLAPGAWELCAELDDETRSRSRPQTVQVAAGAEPEPVRFVVQRRAALIVTVRTESTFVNAPIACWMKRWDLEREPTARDVGLGKSAFHRDSRPFEIRGLEPGRYAIGAAFGAFAVEAPQVYRTVDVARGLTRITIDLPDPPPDFALRVRLLDPDGNAVTRATWSIHRGGASSIGAESIVRADGVHYLESFEDTKTGRPLYRLEARTAQWGAVSREFEWDPAAIVEMRYRGVAQVTATIRGYAGSGYEGRIRYQWEDPAARPDPSIVDFGERSGIARDGSVAALPAQTGKRVLALYVNTGSLSWTRVAEKEFDLRAGAQDVAIELPKLHALRVTWKGEGRPDLMLFGTREGIPVDQQWWTAEVDANGVATFDALLPGRYTINAPGADAGEQRTIEIPAQSDISLP
jgi:hypothetical protein